MKLSSDRVNTMAKNMRAARVDRGYTQEEVAEMAGISPVYYGQLELGNKSPSLETILNIADALHVSLDTLIYGATPESTWNDLLRILRRCDAKSLEKIKKVLYVMIDEFVER